MTLNPAFVPPSGSPCRNGPLRRCSRPALPAAAAKVTSPKEQFGFSIGDDYQLVNYKQLVAYWKKLDAESDRMKLVEIGKTAEGRTMIMAIITSPANHARLARIKDIARRLALAEGLSDAAARKLAAEGKAVVWIDGGLHATEILGSQQLVELVWRMVARDDAGDPPHPRRRRPPGRAGQSRRARPRRRLVHAREGAGQAVDERRPRPLPEVHRPRQQPRLLHEHPAGDQGHEPAALHRVASPDPLQPPPDRAGRDGPLRAALPRPLQLRLRPAHPGRARPRLGLHAQPLRHRGQARGDDEVRAPAIRPGGTAASGAPATSTTSSAS